MTRLDAHLVDAMGSDTSSHGPGVDVVLPDGTTLAIAARTAMRETLDHHPTHVDVRPGSTTHLYGALTIATDAVIDRVLPDLPRYELADRPCIRMGAVSIDLAVEDRWAMVDLWSASSGISTVLRESPSASAIASDLLDNVGASGVGLVDVDSQEWVCIRHAPTRFQPPGDPSVLRSLDLLADLLARQEAGGHGDRR